MTSSLGASALPSMEAWRRRILERRQTEKGTSKERVLKSVNFQEPDRVPIDLWVASEIRQHMVDYFGCDYESVLELLGVDFRVVQGPRYVGPKLDLHPDGSMSDVWGVQRKRVTFGEGNRQGTYLELVRSPLAEMTSVREVELYAGWPSVDWWDFGGIAEECRQHPGKCIVYAGDRLDRTAQLKTAMYLRGVEQILLDLTLNPAIAECIFERITTYFIEYNRRVFEAAAKEIDIFMMGDDFGMQTNLLMSVGTWERFLAPGFRSYIDLAHRYKVKVMHHTCGAVDLIIPKFIDAGLDILQSLQPRAANMNLSRLKEKYGRHIAFHGSVDIQETLPRGSPKEIRREVEERMKVGKPGGGFIICTAHNLQADVPLENILALLDAYHEFAAY